MKNNYFQFKKFSVCHAKCAMKVGTDAVLLGAWANVYDDKPILDVGTGSGIIALMMAQRFSDNDIVAIDIDDGAVEQAKENFNNSPWRERLMAFKDDFANSNLIGKAIFGTIVSNPPFFSEQVFSPDCKRNMARRVNMLPTELFLRNMALCMHEEAAATIIIPFQRVTEVVGMAAINGLFLARRTDVKTKPGKSPKRTLLEFRKNIKPTVFSEIVLNNEDNSMSNQYRNLTKNFYL